MDKSLLGTAWSRVKNHIALDGKCREEVLTLLGDILNYPAPGTPAAPVAPPPPAGARQRIALCLGHARSGDEGVDSVDGVSEEEYNHPLIERVASKLRAAGHDILTVPYYQGNGYTAAMTWLANFLITQKITGAVEFHFNASTGTARGHEFLQWRESVGGGALAKCLLRAFDIAFPDHPSRGVKKLGAGDRGALFVSLTHCPAVIAEPFFGDNREEWNLFSSEEGIDRLVDAYAAGIGEWIGGRA